VIDQGQDRLSDALAELALSASGGGGGIRTMFGTIITATATTVMVRPDSMATGQMGPLPFVCGKATINARVLCLYLPDNEKWVVIGK